MQKHVNLVDLVKSFPTNIFLQNLASIQKRTSSIKFAHLAEKSEKGSISNLSTKALTPVRIHDFDDLALQRRVRRVSRVFARLRTQRRRRDRIWALVQHPSGSLSRPRPGRGTYAKIRSLGGVNM